MDKLELRKKYLQLRLELAEEEYLQRNRQLVDLFFASIDLSDTYYLHTFLPITKFKEVNTWQIITSIQQKYAHVQLVVPKVVGSILKHYIYVNKEQLTMDKWGIPEPKYGKIVTPNQIDMVLIPLVIADQQGNRIGYGKGYYDRFLSQCKSNIKKIGLSLFPLVKENIDAETTDVQLNACLTPDSFVSFH